ncbi:MAG: hypothetical protein E7311_06395 [Clostridiales bacterium]|nr:hypothetical protein [Clostridiales bacterium]
MRMLKVYWKNIEVAELSMSDEKKFEYTLIIPNLRKAKREGLQVGTLLNTDFNEDFPEWIIDRVPKNILNDGEEASFKWLAETGGRLQTDKFSFVEEIA